MKTISLILAGLIATSAIAQEEQEAALVKTYLFEDTPVLPEDSWIFSLPWNHVFCLTSLDFIFPGVGLSFREKKSNSGSSWDFRAIANSPLMTSFGFATIDYNRFYYFQKEESSWYICGGLGVMISQESGFKGITPSIPVRIGYQTSFFMIDLGCMLIKISDSDPPYVPLPVPEFRIGIGF